MSENQKHTALVVEDVDEITFNMTTALKNAAITSSTHRMQKTQSKWLKPIGRR